MICEVVEGRDIVEEYLLGRLDEGDRHAFETHYFECPTCFERLAATRAVQELLVRDPSAGASRGARTGAWPRAWRAGLAAAATLAVIVGGWLVRGAGGAAPSSGAPSASQAPAPAVIEKTGPAPPATSLDELARFDAPPYTPVTWRDASTPEREAFREAMARYVGGDYAAALRGLRKAASQDPESADAWFFLGVSALLAGQSDLGIDALQRTLALGDTPYLEEAHFYLAKASLRTGNVSAARAHLEKIVALRGDLESAARALLGRLPP